MPKGKIYALTHGTPNKLQFQFNESSLEEGYKNTLYDESYWSQKVARDLDLEQYIINQEPNLHWVIETSAEILKTYSEVLFPILNLPTLKLAQTLGIKTILSGFGGDEIISQSGSLYLQELKCKRKYIKYIYEKICGYSLVKSYRAREEEPFEQYLTNKVLSLKNIKYIRPKTISEREFRMTQGDLSLHWQKRQEVSIKLAKHFGINYKFPFTNTNLIKFFQDLPPHFKYFHGKNRYMMRKLLEQRLLKEIAWRKDKAGCTTPAGRFFLIRNLPQVFLERITDNYQGKLCEYLKIKEIRSRLSMGPVFDSSFLRILVAALMVAHLENTNGSIIN